LKNREIFTLSQGIQAAGDLTGAKLAYALAKNLKVVSEEITHLQSGLKLSDERMTAYENDRQELCATHSVKDGDGNSKYIGEGDDKVFDIIDVEAYNVDWEVLKEKYADDLEDQKLTKEEYLALLEEASDIKIHMVKLENFPDTVSAALINQLMLMIEDE